MTTDELIEYLKTLPPKTEIYYQDMNFGGPDEPLTTWNLTFEDGILLVDSQLWEECN